MGGNTKYSRFVDQAALRVPSFSLLFLYFGITRRYMQKIFLFGNFYFFTRKKVDFLAIILLFTASVRSRPPGPPAVPGVI